VAKNEMIYKVSIELAMKKREVEEGILKLEKLENEKKTSESIKYL
jgi:hypothetical protein